MSLFSFLKGKKKPADQPPQTPAAPGALPDQATQNPVSSAPPLPKITSTISAPPPQASAFAKKVVPRQGSLAAALKASTGIPSPKGPSSTQSAAFKPKVSVVMKPTSAPAPAPSQVANSPATLPSDAPESIDIATTDLIGLLPEGIILSGAAGIPPQLSLPTLEIMPQLSVGRVTFSLQRILDLFPKEAIDPSVSGSAGDVKIKIPLHWIIPKLPPSVMSLSSTQVRQHIDESIEIPFAERGEPGASSVTSPASQGEHPAVPATPPTPPPPNPAPEAVKVPEPVSLPLPVPVPAAATPPPAPSLPPPAITPQAKPLPVTPQAARPAGMPPLPSVASKVPSPKPAAPLPPPPPMTPLIATPSRSTANLRPPNPSHSTLSPEDANKALTMGIPLPSRPSVGPKISQSVSHPGIKLPPPSIPPISKPSAVPSTPPVPSAPAPAAAAPIPPESRASTKPIPALPSPSLPPPLSSTPATKAPGPKLPVPMAPPAGAKPPLAAASLPKPVIPAPAIPASPSPNPVPPSPRPTAVPVTAPAPVPSAKHDLLPAATSAEVGINKILGEPEKQGVRLQEIVELVKSKFKLMGVVISTEDGLPVVASLPADMDLNLWSRVAPLVFRKLEVEDATVQPGLPRRSLVCCGKNWHSIYQENGVYLTIIHPIESLNSDFHERNQSLVHEIARQYTRPLTSA